MGLNLRPSPVWTATSPYVWKILKRIVKQLTNNQLFLNKSVYFKDIVQCYVDLFFKNFRLIKISIFCSCSIYIFMINFYFNIYKIYWRSSKINVFVSVLGGSAYYNIVFITFYVISGSFAPFCGTSMDVIETLISYCRDRRCVLWGF